MNGNNRYTPNFSPDDALTVAETVFIQNLAFEAGYDSTRLPLITTGIVAPASTPTAIGDIYVNTVADTVYIATGTSGAGDWVLLTGGGGGGGSPGGSNTQVQFNDGGAFSGDAGLTYDKTTDTLTAGDVVVGDEAYGVGWNGSLEVPTKNAVFDKIESMPGILLGIFGDGSDGNVTISSGTTTLTRDMFYLSLTINGTGVLNTAGFKVYVQNTLDISAAQSGAIINNGGNGNAGATAGTGGIAATVAGQGTTLAVGTANVGGAGGTAAGSAGGGAGAVTGAVGGGMPAGGAGGLGSGGAGGAGSTAATPTTGGFSLRRYIPDFVRITSGAIGLYTTSRNASGGGGGGDGVAGGGGGSGGATGGAIVIYAQTIIRGTNTNTDIIRARGGTGGNGGSAIAGNRGGGGGGTGGAGGFIYLCFAYLTGSTITNALDASGGGGGNGGNGFGTGVGGAGGGRGGGGRIITINLLTGAGTELAPDNGAAGGAASGVTGGTGAAQVLSRANL